MNITTTVEGLERYPVNLRYSRELRHNIPALKEILVPTPAGQHIPLGLLADIRVENPVGYNVAWSGEYEYMQRAKERLRLVVPMTLVIIFIIIYLSTKSFLETAIVLLAVPFSLVGVFWLMWWLDYNLSIAVWVGIIALAGVSAETGVVMLLYLDVSYKDAVKQGKMRHRKDLVEAVYHGAVRRVRPKLMTAIAAMAGLLPIMWSTGTGAAVMKRIATPMVGGMMTSVAVVLLV